MRMLLLPFPCRLPGLPLLWGPLHYLFSSGMWRAIICRGSRHCTTQPWRSLTRSVSTFRKLLGMRLQSTGWMVWTSSRGGHCGTGFFSSLLNMAADRGIVFWGKAVRGKYVCNTGAQVLDNTAWPAITSMVSINYRETNES